MLEGPAFDAAYLQHEVPFHRNASLAVRDKLVPSVQTVEFKMHLQTVLPHFQHHLDLTIEAAKKLGRKYIAITDHSKRVSMANGLDADRLRAHWEDIRAVNDQIKGIELLCGIECDILEDATILTAADIVAGATGLLEVKIGARTGGVTFVPPRYFIS